MSIYCHIFDFGLVINFMVSIFLSISLFIYFVLFLISASFSQTNKRPDRRHKLIFLDMSHSLSLFLSNQREINSQKIIINKNISISNKQSFFFDDQYIKYKYSSTWNLKRSSSYYSIQTSKLFIFQRYFINIRIINHLFYQTNIFSQIINKIDSI